MTVTKHQAQMIANLASACRPTGARRWDTAGTMAALAKLHERDLAGVILATIRAATDRDAETPGVIPSAGSHWSERLAAAPFVPNVVDSSERCSICSESKPSCLIHHGGRCPECCEDDSTCDHHDFESVASAARRRAESDPAALTGAVRALKASIEATEEAPVKTLDELKSERPEFAARLAAIEAKHPAPPMQEPTPPPPDPAVGDPEASEEAANG